MRAVVYREYGGPDVLAVEEIATPAPAPDEVLIRVHATSINDFDWHLLTGRPLINRIGGLRTPKHLVLGADVAGTVEALGRDVTGLRVGDAVVGDLSPFGFGGFAEYACAPASALAPKPASLTFEQAAAVPQAGGLAMTALRWRLPITAGQAVLVNGAGGGVGTFAIQIAASFGAEITGVDAAHKLDAVRAAGAHHVIDYAEQDFTETGLTYDLIIDVAAHHSMARYRRTLRPGGVCSLIGGSYGRIVMVMSVGQAASRVGGRRVGVPIWRPNDPGETAFLSGLLEDGSVVPVIDSVVPLDGVPDAFRRFGAQQHSGKIIVTMPR
jgi:NADPH:quinone reductase-like Zn-dependent oxidoreductase